MMPGRAEWLGLIMRGAAGLAAVGLCLTVCAGVALGQGAAGGASQTVSIGDVIQAEDAAAQPQIGAQARVAGAAVVASAAIHILYVHGMNDIGADDSRMLRDALCSYRHLCATGTPETIWAEGPFALSTHAPQLDYLGQPVWASDEAWHASAPFLVRYRLTGGGHVPIVLDELNWFPLVYPLKCEFLLPGDARLSGGTGSYETICNAPAKLANDGKHFQSYPFPANGPLFSGDLPRQKGTLANRDLKTGVMDWGFGDAVLTLGPLRDILFAAIRQLMTQSLADDQGAQANAPPMPIFLITHSLGSYISLAAMDSAWTVSHRAEELDFGITAEQAAAADYFAAHTMGFYFLANQIALLELSRLATPPVALAADCSESAAGQSTAPEPSTVAFAHYGCMRTSYLKTHPAEAALSKAPQIIAYSAADDLLSWYVPQIPGIAIVNRRAKNSGFRVPGLFAWPVSAHDNYAKNPKVIHGIFGPTR